LGGFLGGLGGRGRRGRNRRNGGISRLIRERSETFRQTLTRGLPPSPHPSPPEEGGEGVAGCKAEFIHRLYPPPLGKEAAHGAPLFSASALNKSFGGVHAVRDVSYGIAAGSVFAIIGPNGAGKSTMLNLISGVYQPDSGSLRFDGRDLAGLPAHSRVRLGIARTFQKIRLFKQRSVLENVIAGFHVHHDVPAWQHLIHGPAFRRDQARCRAEAMDLLAFAGLAGQCDARAGALSYGEQRMLELARALATKPRLLLIDEPAAGLNGAEVDRLLDRILTIRDGGVTVVVVEHNMELVMNVADRILVIDYGRHLFEGAPEEVQKHPDVVAAYLGEGNCPE
jgi:branched-chain amino acid transport system ATP-binding protein